VPHSDVKIRKKQKKKPTMGKYMEVTSEVVNIIIPLYKK
jgi:hypothetical protein